MRDPHVVSLTYDLVTDDDLVFDAKPLARESPCYRLTLEGEVLSVVMKEHFGTEQSARAVVEEYLRAWEAHAILQPVPRKIRFQYQRGEVVDRNPPPPSPPGAHLMASAHLHGTGSLVATARLIVSKYPGPPNGFALSPDAETLWDRYRGYLDGRELLQSMAYFCLTVVEEAAGSRRQASQYYQIAPKVLSKLGELTDRRGDKRSARKYSVALRPLSATELVWIEAAVKAIALRVGTRDSDPAASLLTLTLSDLPAL